MNKFEKWLYILFDKTSGLKNLIISYNEKRMDLERIRKEKEMLELELDLMEKDQENSVEIQQRSKKINKKLKAIRNLNQFKEIKIKKLILEIDVLEKKVTRIKNSTENIEVKQNKLLKLKMRHNDNNQNVEIDIIIENLTNKFEELKNLLNNEEITENKLLYCEKELLKLKYGIDLRKKFEKKVDDNKDKEIGKKEKFLRSNKIFDSIWEGWKFSEILKEKRKVLEKNKTIKSSGYLYHQYLLSIFFLTLSIVVVELIIIFFFKTLFEKIFIWPITIYLALSFISMCFYIKTSLGEFFYEIFNIFSTVGGLLSLFCVMIYAFTDIILKLSNLYFIENNLETERIIFVIGLFLLLIFLILNIQKLINIFRIEKITSIKININQIMRLLVGIVSLFFAYFSIFSIIKNNKNINLENTDFVVDIKIPNFETSKGKILIGGEEIPIEVRENRIKTENRNKIEEKDIIVNVGNDEIKIMNCTKNNCESTKKGKVINLKNSSFILFENNEKKHEYECENKYNSSELIEKCYKEDEKVKNINKIINGNILKGKIFKIEDEYYIFDRNTISTLENVNYIMHPIKILFLSLIFFITLYLLFKGNKDYYSNQKKERKERKRFIKFLIGKDIKKYKKDKLREEIEELESIFNFGIFKVFFTIPPLITIIFGVFNFIQKPEINFKINPYSAFSIMLLVVVISTVILLIFIRFIVQKAVEIMFLPKNEFFEFTEIILEIIGENDVVV